MKLSMYSNFMRIMKQHGIEYAASYAESQGFSGVELIIGFDSDVIRDVDHAKEIKQVLDRHGLGVSCFSAAGDIYTKGADMTKESPAVGRLCHIADMASALGSPFLHHTIVLNWVPEKHIGMPPFEEILDYLVENCTKVAKYCKKLGITVLYEPQGLYVNGLKQLGIFYGEMKKRNDNVGICGDIGNILFVDESPVDFYKAFAKEFCHVHLKDYRSLADGESGEYNVTLGGTRLQEALIGTGIIDFDTCIDILKKSGYNGYISLENTYSDEKLDACYAQDLSTLRRYFDFE